MAIVFSETKKKQQRLILVFAAVILATALVLWLGVFHKSPKPLLPLPLPVKKITIDFSIFDQPILSQMQLFQEIPAFDGQIERENPFLPFSPTPTPQKKP